MSHLKKILNEDSKTTSNGAVLTYSVQAYDTIDDVLLVCKNNGQPSSRADILSSIGYIALNINGEQIVYTPASTLFDIYDFLGTQVFQGANVPKNVMSLNLGRLMYKVPEIEDLFAWGCMDISTIQIQIYCKNTVTGVSDIEIKTERRPISQRMGSYIKVINYPQSMGTAGMSTVDNLPRDNTQEAYLAVLAYNAGGVISRGECVVNGISIIQPTTPDVANYTAATRCFQPVTGIYPYLFNDGAARAMLPMDRVTELRFKTEFSTAPTSDYNLVAISMKNVPSGIKAAFNG